MKKKISNIFKIILIAGFAIRPSCLVLAQDLSVFFEQDPLFSETNILPGETVTRWVQVNNNSAQAEQVAAEAINYPGFPIPDNVPSDDLSRALVVIIREQGGPDVYGGSLGEKTLFDFYQDGEIYLSDVNSGHSKKYDFEISFPAEKQDFWQGKTTFFDILVGFVGQEGSSSSGNGETSTGSLTGGGAGLPPGLSISSESQVWTDTENCTIVITWSTNYFSTSRIIYSAEGGSHILDLDEADYGYDFSHEGDDSGQEKVTSHSVTLSVLNPGVKYYYRCVSHGSLAVSREMSFETSCCEREDEEGGTQANDSEPIKAAGIVNNIDIVGQNSPSTGGKKESEKEPVDTDNRPSPARQAFEQIMGMMKNKEETSSDEQIKQASIFTNLLASIGNIFKGQDSCLPPWIILILIIYSLWKHRQSRGRKERKIWFVWSAVLFAIFICFYLGRCGCPYAWTFLVLGIITLGIRRATANNKEAK